MPPCSSWEAPCCPACPCPPTHPAPRCIHEYQLTPHSLYAAVSIGLETDTIVAVLNRLSKNVLPPEIKRFVRGCTQNYGKAGLGASAHPQQRASAATPISSDGGSCKADSGRTACGRRR